jgi:hypothetical protein
MSEERPEHDREDGNCVLEAWAIVYRLWMPMNQGKRERDYDRRDCTESVKCEYEVRNRTSCGPRVNPCFTSVSQEDPDDPTCESHNATANDIGYDQLLRMIIIPVECIPVYSRPPTTLTA